MKLSPQDLKLGNYLAEFPMRHSVPLYFGNPNDEASKVNNGTGTLLKRGNRLYVATNHHVLEEYRTRLQVEGGISLQAGGLYVAELEGRISFEDVNLDIAVLDFSDTKPEQFRMFGDVTTEFYEVGDLEPIETSGTVVAFGGFPGVFRMQVATNKLNFYTLSSGASVVEEINDRQIVVNIDHTEGNITNLGLQTPPAKLGGLSGGPVFLVSSVRGILTLTFAGIIYACNENFNVMLARPATLFAEAL